MTGSKNPLSVNYVSEERILESIAFLDNLEFIFKVIVMNYYLDLLIINGYEVKFIDNKNISVFKKKIKSDYANQSTIEIKKMQPFPSNQSFQLKKILSLESSDAFSFPSFPGIIFLSLQISNENFALTFFTASNKYFNTFLKFFKVNFFQIVY